MSWSAQQYVMFEDERTRPVRDLLSAVPNREARRAVDIGCGPGNSTEVLAAQFPQAQISGFDNSADMIFAARKRLPQVQFDLADVETWDAAGPFDVILSNAVLQWVPNHASLLPRLIEKLSQGGSFAIQMPDNLDEPAHEIMRAVAAREPWAAQLSGAKRQPMLGAGDYYEMLKPHCARVDIWRTIYHHVMTQGASGVVEWFKGSALRPFLAPLSPLAQSEFLYQYETEVARVYPALNDGSVLLPFPRLFIVATR